MSTTTPPPTKRQKTEPPYELIYWPTIPGRGEYIRLCFEATQTPYTDRTNPPSSSPPTAQPVLDLIFPPQKTAPSTSNAPPNPPPLAPPILRHGPLTISQTPNILLYLGPRLGLAGAAAAADDENAIYRINQLALTALDGFCNEVHETHHPISITDYYEAQKGEAKKRAKEYVEERLPKYLAYFERVLREGGTGEGGWLYGEEMTWADLVLWQGIDGVGFAFPRAMEEMKRSGEYGRVFALCERVAGREGVKGYLESGRRLGYSSGIWRRYPELDIDR